MGQVSATSAIDIDAAPEVVLAALADYQTVRPAILPANYRDFAYNDDGTVHWILQATEKRQRDVLADVAVTADSVTETDRNSSMVTVYRVGSAGAGARVEVTTSWQGAGGIGGFFEKTFAPKGLSRIQAELLGNLKTRLEVGA
ncbi:MAG: SRPBCC family protein [Gordonia sp. (in: high G+C Gram-positive bacteria)]|uniref:SRPBCC family protein n=1 Tax=Gordonia sp. (in: high G+C Gram-positive bacteria) TaxID=84139 RepID=UPI0039E69737